MKKSLQLYALIHSMSKSEKRYLKINNHRGRSIYMKVFDAILEQKSYDNTELKKILAAQDIRSPLPRVQHHLYALLLRSLAAFHAQHHPRYQVMDKIKHYILLRNRGLHQQSKAVLRKALQLAEVHNYYGLVLEIADLMEDWVTEEKSYPLALEQKTHLIDLVNDTSQFIHSIAALKQQVFELRLFFLQHKFARTTAQRSLLKSYETAPLKILDQTSNLLKKRLLLTVLVYVYYGLQDYESLIEIEKKRIALLQKNTASAHISPFLVYSYHRNLLWIYLSNNQYKQHHQLQQALQKDPRVLGRSDVGFYAIKLSLAQAISSMYADLNQHHYARAYRQIKPIWMVFEHKKIDWDIELLIQSLILFLNTTFCLGKFEECLEWLNYMEQEIPSSYLLPYQNMGKIAHLLIHDGLGHQQLIENIIESTRIRLYRKFNFFFVANTFLKYFRRRIKTKPQNQEDILMKYQLEMEQIAQEEVQKGFFILFNFVDWFEAEIKACYIADLYK